MHSEQQINTLAIEDLWIYRHLVNQTYLVAIIKAKLDPVLARN